MWLQTATMARCHVDGIINWLSRASKAVKVYKNNKK